MWTDELFPTFFLCVIFQLLHFQCSHWIFPKLRKAYSQVWLCCDFSCLRLKPCPWFKQCDRNYIPHTDIDVRTYLTPCWQKDSREAEMLNESVILSGAIQCVSPVSIFSGLNVCDSPFLSDFFARTSLSSLGFIFHSQISFCSAITSNSDPPPLPSN